LQSRLFLFLYRVSNLGESRVIPQVKAAKLQLLPFPALLEDNPLTKRLRELCQLQLSLNRKFAMLKTERNKRALERQIVSNDARIDDLVFELYGLTAGEIAVVTQTEITAAHLDDSSDEVSTVQMVQ
ncbi:MAG: hypothetical protein ACRD4C_08455, partial [Candidatus Acidiferrales bacterium]